MSGTMERRRFLALAGLAATGAVAGCGPASTRGVAAPGPLGQGTGEGVDLAALRRALSGPLLLPGDRGYTVAAQPFNAALAARRPVAIAQVANTADAATCVRLAGGRGVTLAARSGGHSYAGWSTPDRGIVIDLAGLRTVRVRGDGTAVVGAGTRLIDVYVALAAAGRAIPSGSCPTVGIGGTTLGGGIGVMARAYGLTCDHLRAADVVTADGEIRTVNRNRDADLYWALRGGGGGNAAVVTSFTFDTVPAPAVTVFSLRFPSVRSAAVLTAWQDWMGAAPDGLWSVCVLAAAAAPTNRVTGAWVGRPSALAGHLAALVAAVGAAPTSRFSRTMSYLGAMKHFAGCAQKTVAACHLRSTPGGTLDREAFHAASRMLEHKLSAASAGEIVGLLPRRAPMALLFDSLRGQVARVGVRETAFPHRSALASVQVYSGSSKAGPAVDAVQRRLAALVGRGAYVNYLNPDQSDWAQAYYGANLSRLRSVVRHYDPDQVFAFGQSLHRA
jgi:FAD/FMN-containing dehydrogenase